MLLKTFMEIISYRITDGSEYCWNCFGHYSHTVDSSTDHYCVSITFDRKTQEVYNLEVCDFDNNRAYRLINPAYKDAYDKEVKTRGVVDAAWEYVNWIDLETEEDFEEKTCAIIAGKEYDTRISVPIDLDPDELAELVKMAHDRDVTVDQLIEDMLVAVINNANDPKLTP